MGFYYLPTCKCIEILPLATSHNAHFCNQFNHVFTLLISMPRNKSINFCQIMPKITLLWQKKHEIFERWGLHPHISVLSDSSPRSPWPPEIGGSSSKSLKQPPHCRFLATRLHSILSIAYIVFF